MIEFFSNFGTLKKSFVGIHSKKKRLPRPGTGWVFQKECFVVELNTVSPVFSSLPTCFNNFSFRSEGASSFGLTGTTTTTSSVAATGCSGFCLDGAAAASCWATTVAFFFLFCFFCLAFSLFLSFFSSNFFFSSSLSSVVALALVTGAGAVAGSTAAENLINRIKKYH